MEDRATLRSDLSAISSPSLERPAAPECSAGRFALGGLVFKALNLNASAFIAVTLPPRVTAATPFNSSLLDTHELLFFFLFSAGSS
jgi:hypothetical protein